MGSNSGAEERVVTQVYPSTLESVDDAERVALQAAEIIGFDEDERHHIGMAVRECMVNAVTHGNRYSAKKTVSLTVVQSGSTLTVKIVDQGSGFDLEELPDPLAENNLFRNSGRGVFLMRAFMDDFKVRRLQDPSGTEVTMVKTKSAEP